MTVIRWLVPYMTWFEKIWRCHMDRQQGAGVVSPWTKNAWMETRRKPRVWVNAVFIFSITNPQGWGDRGQRARFRAGPEDHPSCPADLGPVLGDPAMNQSWAWSSLRPQLVVTATGRLRVDLSPSQGSGENKWHYCLWWHREFDSAVQTWAYT